MAKYLIIGTTGQLGQAFAQRLGGEAIGTSRAELDLTLPGAAEGCVANYRPKVVLNCAAYNYVDRAETEPELAFAVNALGVRELARACQKVGAFLVHFSTDYVFGLDSQRHLPYTESDLPGPINVYGVSKLAGEYFVRGILTRHLVVRTCGLYGRLGGGGKKTNFVEAILTQAGSGQPLRVVADQVCSPTYVPDLVEAVLQCLEQGLTGLVHLVNEGAVSWFDLARAIVRLQGLSLEVIAVPSAERRTSARRPAYSALRSEYPNIPQPRPWELALREYLQARRSIPN